MRVWYNHGYSQTRDAFTLIKSGAPSEFYLIATHGKALAPVFLEANQCAIEPEIPRTGPGGENAYVDWCLDFARTNKVDVFVAQRGRAAIGRRSKEFKAIGTTVVVAADAAILDMIDNKGVFYTACSHQQLPTPIVHKIASVEEFDKAVASIRDAGFNACIKPPFGVFASGYFRLDDRAPLFNQLMTIENRSLQTNVVRSAIAEMGSDMPQMLVMQHLPGVEWSVDCLCQDGAILAAVSRRKQGNAQLVEIDSVAIDLARKVAKLFRLSNIVNIQLKSASLEGDDPYVLEINPRMSGGCMYAAVAGINLPLLQLLNVTGKLQHSDIPSGVSVTVASVNTAVDLTPLTRIADHA
jgi:glutathione synthase/RimK-type ligase-like ATP-grasp enzyme